MNTNSKAVRRGSQFLRWCSRACILTGIAALGVYTFLWAEALQYQALRHRRFDATPIAAAATEAPGCSGLAASPDASLGKLEIPSLGLSVIVLEGDDPHTLRLGAGHIPGTAWVGSSGNVAIAAHRDTFFRKLRGIHDNDAIQLTTLDASYSYIVESARVLAPSRTEILDNGTEPTLTLITCYPFYYVGPAPYRFVVRARQVSTTLRSVSTCSAQGN